MRRICVALSVLVLLVGAFALGRPVRATAAQAGTPTTSAVAGADETLLAVTVARDQLPTGEGLVYIGRVTFAPGARQTCGCPDERGTVLTVVESGTFTFEIESSEGRINRGADTDGATEEPAPAGVPFTLAAGDALVFPGKRRVEANEGSEPAVYLFALLLAPVGPPDPDPSDVGVRTSETLGVVVGPWPDLGSGPVAITLRRSVLEPGASLAAPPTALQVVVPDDAQIAATPTALTAGDDGTTANQGAEPIGVLVLSLVPAGGDATPQA